MPIKVHKENGKWFRNDNGILVGNDIPKQSVRYLFFSLLYGEYSFIEGTVSTFVAYPEKSGGYYILA